MCGCCPDPQFVTVSTCGNFTTAEDTAATGNLVFDNDPGPLLSGYVTLTSLSISTPDTNAVLFNDGVLIIPSVAGTGVAPGDSQTVFVSDIGELVAASATAGSPVTGQVCVNASRRVV
ncbi:hypothetical protein SRABI80_02369 [Peribacillus frigoritolerans]|uniref:S-Ena type endospore appendage n=1 Tax=Peribacillus frigoritolerans TaxID=450367 RepID=UPI001E06A02F|nr:S-Ena type endospore appendage [Peribacillus frigoritolerans]MED3710800.1 hypothetical protein [Peribacillus frigoritolerans]CAH0224557.1 hypothetical protein SRABI80_02369 [Peribacillus frigoritolerans]